MQFLYQRRRNLQTLELRRWRGRLLPSAATAVTNLNLTFDDSAASLPDSGPLLSGIFAPTDFEPFDSFPGSPGSPPFGSSLSVFNGTDPNGTWYLRLRDDRTGNTGSLSGGWCLEVFPPCALGPPGRVSSLAVAKLANGVARLTWPVPTRASSYDVVRGNLDALHASLGD